jgi:hypothetical protein
MSKAEPKPPLVEHPICPELFADGSAGFFVRNGVVTITLSSMRVDHGKSEGPLRHQVIGRLTMPIAGAEGLVRGLSELLKRQNPDREACPDQKRFQ